MMRVALLELIVLGFASSVAAQGHVWVVDDSGGADFTTIQAAINAADEGDILLVKEGTYSGMHVHQKSLTIQAEKGALVTIDSTTGSNLVTSLTSSQSVRLRGLVMSAEDFDDSPGLKLSNNSGSVWVEDCSASGSVGYFAEPGIRVQNSSKVVLIRTTATGDELSGCSVIDSPVAGAGLELHGSSVHAFGCTFTGADGHLYADEEGGAGNCTRQNGGDGIRSFAAQDFLFLSDCTAHGGEGSCSSHEWGIANGTGGRGLRMTGVANVLDSRIEGGLEVSYFNPFSGELVFCAHAGLDHSGPITFHGGRALRFTWEGPAREGNTVELSFEGPPHVAVWIATGPKTEAQFKVSPFGSALIGQPQRVDFAGFTDEHGQLSVTVELPPLLPLVEGREGFAQAYYLDPHPAGPLSGTGKIRHVPLRFVRGEGSMLVGLDESF